MALDEVFMHLRIFEIGQKFGENLRQGAGGHLTGHVYSSYLKIVLEAMTLLWTMLYEYFAFDVPAPKLRKAFKTGKLRLTADQLKGSGSVIHLHPASYEKALKARKAGRGVRLDITKHEIKKGYKQAQGGSIWSKVWGGIKSAFKFAKDSGLLSRAADAAVPAIATALGAPQGAIPARAAIRSMSGIGVYDDAGDKEGGRLTMTDVKKGAKRALSYAKRKGILTDVVDSGEKYLLFKATRPEHEDLIKSIRGEVRRRYSVGVAKPKAMIYPHMRDHEAYETLWIKKLKACNKNLPFAIKK
ncbi:uncharacterized protein PHALS_03977 [Plasmopara halstedii]|uniref:Uncharacterized protein n=1 Tax=Plasmopara halstedii TaxID=4781 RepID=A0A0N7L7K4_PLAHL|nr:uncharacterized protein PHALS_03977 [Plasmopara halstedii]CEG47323.1 hypothetical protein PHALS_03977 [Plasmopara halstedii]|eukprot:XP_024583692.1 hypothetical protein PHALS_03977 [Plasmopara halstedii]